MLTNSEIVSVLRLLARDDNSGDLMFWTNDSGPFWSSKQNGSLCIGINCSDAFWWATADVEELKSAEDVQALEKALDDAREVGCADDGPLLFCSRQRKLRPQGAMYKHIDKRAWHLFDAAGPERDAKAPGNTPRPEAVA